MEKEVEKKKKELENEYESENSITGPQESMGKLRQTFVFFLMDRITVSK